MLFYCIIVILHNQRGVSHMVINFAYYALYFCYLGLTALQLLFAPYRSAGRLDWGSVLYHFIATGAIAMFNYELYLLRSVYEEPSQMVVVWLATVLLAGASYHALSYYPQLKLNPFWKKVY